MFDRDPKAEAWGVTCVENLFIRDYLPAARGDQVKVYLWGLYQSGRPQGFFAMEDAAAELEMEKKDVESALRYWERRGLVTIASNDPPVYVFHSPMERATSGEGLSADDSYVDFAESVYAAFGSRRKVRPAEIAQAWEWVQDLGLSREAVLMLINHLIDVSGPQFSFRKGESTAAAMRQGGVVSAEDAEAWLKNDLSLRKGTESVLRALGKRGRLASDAEIDLYRKWRDSWGFSHEAILEATRETTRGEPTFAYLDGILSGIRKRTDSRTAAGLEKHLKEEKDEFEAALEITGALRPAVSRQIAVNLYRDWRKVFPHEVLKAAAGECARSGGGADEMSRLLSSWEEKGLLTEEAVQAHLARFRAAGADLKTLCEICGRPGRITQADRNWYAKWQKAGFGLDMLILAAQKAFGITGNKIAYMDSILSSWQKNGITTPEAAGMETADRPAAGPRPEKVLSAQRFGQREYTEEEMRGTSDDMILAAILAARQNATEDSDEQ